MPIKNLLKIITKKQQEREEEEIKKVAAELRKVMALPAVKDLIGEVEISSYSTGGSSYSWGSLSLTKNGLEVVTGYHDSCGDSPFSSSERNRPNKIPPKNFEVIVERYSLTIADVEALRQKLEE